MRSKDVGIRLSGVLATCVVDNTQTNKQKNMVQCNSLRLNSAYKEEVRSVVPSVLHDVLRLPYMMS